MKIDYEKRINDLLEGVDADAVALVPGANMVYFTGLHYHLSERPIIALITSEGLSFIVPSFEVTKLGERPDLEAATFSWTDEAGYKGAFRQAASELRLDDRHLALDGETMRVFEWLALQDAGVNMRRVRDIGEDLKILRATKTEAEVAWMREAVRISEVALSRTLSAVSPGMTERAIAALLSDELSAAGSSGHAFNPIVLTGPQSALPHGSVSDRPLGPDELLLLDFGGTHMGYPADITRTFCLGTPSDEFRAIHEIVLRANEAARAAVRPGATCASVDDAARGVIEAAGYGQYFNHRTGHGLGLETHELPNIVAGNDMILEPGMVFTIEPGIYIPGKGGVRIEDNVVVTSDGCEVLTSFSRELSI